MKHWHFKEKFHTDHSQGFEGLTDKRWLAVDIYPPLATNTEVKIICLVYKNDGFELIYYCQQLQFGEQMTEQLSCFLADRWNF